MKAVIKTGGKQYIVSLGQEIKIEKIEKEAGEIIDFENVFLVFDEDSGKTNIGAPNLKTKVEGRVIQQDKHKKVIIFKYKPKKRYKVKKGHRQPYTLIQIIRIGDEKLETTKATKPITKKEPIKPEEKKDVKTKTQIVKDKKEEKKSEDKKDGFFE
ncbi:50S ribosomal protein L21 [bacterium]|nr:MAG: 50S ribosomal protein L21 [bacterium]